MHTDNLSAWTHPHVFDVGNRAAERGVRLVVWITAAAMTVEIIAGWWFNSMALLADGWHMSSHALALGLSVFAYAAARRYAGDPRFAFGTWKIEVLAGFASAIVLLGVAVLMLVASIGRLLAPQPIAYQEALVVASLGLVVNLFCARILGAAGDHPADELERRQADHRRHRDHNLAAAYFHVLADAVTSVLALAALAGGWIYGWSWLDPLSGVIGSVLIAVWAAGLLAETGRVLLDREMDHPVVEAIRSAVETVAAAGATRVTDLHVWRVGRRTYACALSVVTHDRNLSPQRVRELLATHAEIVHATIEIQQCPDAQVES